MAWTDSDSLSDENENIEDISDDDICSKSEIDKLFTIKYQILAEEQISRRNTYILRLCSNKYLQSHNIDLIFNSCVENCIYILDH